MKRIESLIRAGVPTLVWGPPGVGKTHAIRHTAQKMGLAVVEVIASLREPSDFAGLPVIRDGEVWLAPPAWARTAMERMTLVFFDELTTAPPAVQAALLRVAIDKVVGDTPLPPTTRIVAAANPPDIAANGWELSPPLANRFAHVEFKLDAGEWVREFPSYWGNPPQLDGVDPALWGRARARVAAFILRRPNLIYTYKDGEIRYASPRTWDYVSRAWATAALDPTSAGDLAAALVGDAPAAEFASWVATCDLREPAEILALGQMYRLPARGDLAHAEMTALAESDEAIATPDAWQRAWEVIDAAASTATDIAALAAGRLLKRGQALYGTPQQVQRFTQFMSAVEVAR